MATTAAEETAASSSKAGPSGPCQSCVVHPIVLLSVVDHYNRVAKDTKKRVVGMLLGSVSKGVVDVTNCYAVPFEEDERDLNIWYLDHNFHEQVRPSPLSACLPRLPLISVARQGHRQPPPPQQGLTMRLGLSPPQTACSRVLLDRCLPCTRR